MKSRPVGSELASWRKPLCWYLLPVALGARRTLTGFSHLPKHVHEHVHSLHIPFKHPTFVGLGSTPALRACPRTSQAGPGWSVF